MCLKTKKKKKIIKILDNYVNMYYTGLVNIAKSDCVDIKVFYQATFIMTFPPF